MDERLRRDIAENYSGWERITGTFWQDGTPWELWKFEHDVEHDGKWWRCVIIEKATLDKDDWSALDYAEDIFAEAWEL